MRRWSQMLALTDDLLIRLAALIDLGHAYAVCALFHHVVIDPTFLRRTRASPAGAPQLLRFPTWVPPYRAAIPIFSFLPSPNC
ncbi:hypothetical protein ABZP36_004837 [Zizania latifolia]